MKHIGKQQPPQDLGSFVKRETPNQWNELHHSAYYPHLYEDCIRQLRSEQGNLSGYTEKPLPEQGHATHVDHFRKRSLFPSRQYVFGWSNMIADEHTLEYGADHKDSVVDGVDAYRKLIDPVAQDPHHFFTYMENGWIIPKAGLNDAEKEMAEYTIETFNLQHPSLLNKREEIIRLVKSYKQGGLADADILACVGTFGFPSVVEYALK